jgi:hypothetical protein
MIKTIFLFLGLQALVYAQPAPRHLERVAYDTKRDRLIVFGGSAFLDGKLRYDSAVHEWDVKTGWSSSTPPLAPHPRNGGALVYHARLKETVLIGGVYEDNKGYQILFDVWLWNGKRWKKNNMLCPVKEPEGVYDPTTGKILVLGEVTNKDKLIDEGARQFELWSFDGADWQRESQDVPVADGFSQLAFNHHRQTLLLPVSENGTLVMYEWNKAGWTKKSVTTMAPTARTRFMFAYDAARQVAYLHGGRTDQKEFLNDLWQWNGSQWTNITPAEALGKKASARMVYGKKEMVEYGGALDENGKTTTTNEIWMLRGGQWVKTNKR